MSGLKDFESFLSTADIHKDDLDAIRFWISRYRERLAESTQPCETHHWMYRGERLDGRFVCERCGVTQ